MRGPPVGTPRRTHGRGDERPRPDRAACRGRRGRRSSVCSSASEPRSPGRSAVSTLTGSRPRRGVGDRSAASLTSRSPSCGSRPSSTDASWELLGHGRLGPRPQWPWTSAAQDSPGDLYRPAARRRRRLTRDRRGARGRRPRPPSRLVLEVGDGGERSSLRRALVDLIEEYARHVGHADLIRSRSTAWSVRTVGVLAVYPVREP